VLVADDDLTVMGTISRALARLGYAVVCAESGVELVDQLADEGPFDLIVTDVSMPWLDGLNAIRSMRTAGLATPVIVITALNDQQIPGQVRVTRYSCGTIRAPRSRSRTCESQVLESRSRRRRAVEGMQSEVSANPAEPAYVFPPALVRLVRAHVTPAERLSPGVVSRYLLI
jgi:CheY-like chemotaxis protein